MPRISLNEFIDFSLRNGPQRLNFVQKLKGRPGYSPAFDFWKKLRDAIVALHRAGATESRPLSSVLVGLTDEKKARLYPAALNGYKRFLRKVKGRTWVEPSQSLWIHSGLEVRIKPEIAFGPPGNPTVAKLHFKKERISRRRVELSSFLMRVSLGSGYSPDAEFGVLDVAKGAFVSSNENLERLPYLLEAEAGAFVSLWHALD